MKLLRFVILPVALLIGVQITWSQEVKIELSEDLFTEGRLYRLSQPDTWDVCTDGEKDNAKLNAHNTHWETMDIRFASRQMPDTWKGSGWFRMKFEIDSTLTGQQMALVGNLNGAAEIYFNDELVSTIGQIGRNKTEEIALRSVDPVQIEMGQQSTQSLLIRYSNFDAHKFWNIHSSGINLFIGHPEDVSFRFKKYNSVVESERNRFHLIFGFLLALAVLHLFLFIYYPVEKANLSCSLFFFFLSGIFLSAVLFQSYSSPTSFLYYRYGETLSMTLAGIVLPFFLYHSVSRKFDWLPFSILLAGIVTLISIFKNPFSHYSIPDLFLLVSTVSGIIFVLYARFKLGKKELNIVLYAFAITLIMLLPGLIEEALNIRILWGNTTLYMNLSPLVAACGYSFYMAKGVAITNRQLQTKLVENEKLSAEKIQAEIDKQQLIEKQKDELEQQVADRTVELRQSLKELKDTQTQLIQQEKLASLGELTAGIAHEIQNPLNFVNNFSDVSSELIDEMNEEIENGDMEEVKAISADLKENLTKIHHHGKRADSIVKGMLEHSRMGAGEKVETDLNAQADEFLRLSYHGIRAKDKGFNASFKLDADPALPKLKVVPQDMGRVLLNLINNAFYAIDDRKKKEEENYQPEVIVTTKFHSDQNNPEVTIAVSDNGKGIPAAIKEKIFQPFFTTKPTGSGTGLGLSLAYDIVKAHGGELKVDSQEGSGTTFIIVLPTSMKS